jgi:uncharacterized protein YukE
MADKIKLNYPAMQEMANQCKAVAQRLAETAKLGQTAAQEMQNGALLGDAGENFANALTSAYVPGVKKLADKFNEVAKDIMDAIQDMKSSDSGAGGLFN